MDPPSPRSGFCYLPTPAKAIARSHKNQTPIAGEKRWPRDLFSCTCLNAMFQGEHLRSRSRQSKETQCRGDKNSIIFYLRFPGPFIQTLCASVSGLTINAFFFIPTTKKGTCVFNLDARANTSAFSHRPLEWLCSHAHLSAFALSSHEHKTMLLSKASKCNDNNHNNNNNMPMVKMESAFDCQLSLLPLQA